MDAFFKLSSNGVRLPISLIVFLLIAGNVLVADAQSVDEPFSLVILSDTQVFRAHNPRDNEGNQICPDATDDEKLTSVACSESATLTDQGWVDSITLPDAGVQWQCTGRLGILNRLGYLCNPVAAADAVVSAISQIGLLGDSWPTAMHCSGGVQSDDGCISRGQENTIRHPSGIIINGDLTETWSGVLNFEKRMFSALYEEPLGPALIWPGLGNHDYQNALDKKLGGNRESPRDAVQWMADKIGEFNSSQAPLANYDLNGAVVVRNHDRLAQKGFRVLVDGKPKTNIVVLKAIGAGREKIVELGDSSRQPWRKVSVRFYDWACLEKAFLRCVKRGWSQIESRTIADAEVSEVTCFDITLNTVIRPNCRSRIDSVNRTGSLSYSFDIGNYRFVQLHNFLGYVPATREKEIKRAMEEGRDPGLENMSGGGFNVVSGEVWLKEELTRATALGKAIVINVHDAKKDRGPLFNLIRDNSFNVVAVFAGHLHETLGKRLEWTSHSGSQVPVILSGAAFSGTMLYVEFYDDYMNWAAMRAWTTEVVSENHDGESFPEDRPNIASRLGRSYGVGSPVFVQDKSWNHGHSPADPLSAAMQGTIEFSLNSGSGGNNVLPIPFCTNVTAFADSSCTADASIDNGSNDPDGGDVTLSQSPASPYGPGNQAVTLTVLNNSGSTASCEATVTVLDVDQPQLVCGNPAEISSADLPISFVAEATDNCGIAAVYIDRLQCLRDDGSGSFCEAQLEGDTITVTGLAAGGSQITWFANADDESGNAIDMSCTVDVAATPKIGGGTFGIIELLLGFLLLISVRYRKFMDAMRTQTSLICPDVAA